MKTRTFLGQPIEMQYTECGRLPNGDRVNAATDAAGPQVIVIGEDTHLLSVPVESHETAVLMGGFILAAGTPDIYDRWINLRTASLGAQLGRIFIGA